LHLIRFAQPEVPWVVGLLSLRASRQSSGSRELPARTVYLIACFNGATLDLSPRYHKDAYSAAIEKVRSEHRTTIPSPRNSMECPKCGTMQVVSDAPGMRVCVKCGFEFRPRSLNDPQGR
jgi:hypothetical protein